MSPAGPRDPHSARHRRRSAGPTELTGLRRARLCGRVVDGGALELLPHFFLRDLLLDARDLAAQHRHALLRRVEELHQRLVVDRVRVFPRLLMYNIIPTPNLPPQL
eukprot:CAMPEP_0174913272 /NCGR_PEP_ID=MMETSP0167-20121228/80233_1 /TAXON_ID=38298 /ORGANISM="Rhodella maculata, Strain CCMP736" /LENGTH=105 /DNA_ID=CAMNT_0016157985 /DNA_START=2081 /DNA_END=2394 /DNA_ORIENTATION=-